MPDPAALTPRRDQAMALQDVAGGGPAGQDPARLASVHEGQAFLTSPRRMPVSGIEDRVHDLVSGLIRRAPWTTRALFQAPRTAAQVAVDPLVPGLAGDAVQRAEFSDRQHVAKEVGDELCSLVHR